MTAPTSPALNVLLLENVHQSARELFASDGFVVEEIKHALKEDELIAKLKSGVNVLGIRSKTRVTARVLAEAKDLLTIGCFCIGTNQVDLATANHAGIPVFNAPFSNTRSVAELVIAEVIALARQLGDRSREVHEGKWRKIATGCMEVRGKTLGIVGYGHIGSQVGVLAEAIGMRVLSYDIRTTLPMGNNRAVESLTELLGASDFVTLHVPETKQTANMIGEREISAMKRGGYLINASRGSVVDIDALAAALKSGHLAGAAVDVFPEEPEANSDGFQSALRGLQNVILTPHVGGSTTEAQAAIGREVAQSLLGFAGAGATTGSVNFPRLELGETKNSHRILNIHKNVPGVLRDINRIVGDHRANIRAQLLGTDNNIGYLIMDLDHDVATQVSDGIAALETSIRTRILY
jgi:D-3-phosphoglycerate dehydrogenase